MPFCPNCGQKIEDGARFCTSCGVLVNAPEPDASSASEYPEYESLGGWLLFFVIFWGISTVLSVYNIIKMVRTPGMFGSPFAVAYIIQYLVAAGVYVACIVLVIKRHPKFLRLFQILRIVNMVAGFICSMASTTNLWSSSGVYLGTLVTSSVGGGILGICLMTMYFCKSVRFRTYMGSTEYLDTALFKIGAKSNK